MLLNAARKNTQNQKKNNGTHEILSQRDRQTDRQTKRMMKQHMILSIYTNCQTEDRQTDRQTDRQKNTQGRVLRSNYCYSTKYHLSVRIVMQQTKYPRN